MIFGRPVDRYQNYEVDLQETHPQRTSSLCYPVSLVSKHLSLIIEFWCLGDFQVEVPDTRPSVSFYAVRVTVCGFKAESSGREIMGKGENYASELETKARFWLECNCCMCNNCSHKSR